MIIEHYDQMMSDPDQYGKDYPVEAERVRQSLCEKGEFAAYEQEFLEVVIKQFSDLLKNVNNTSLRDGILEKFYDCGKEYLVPCIESHQEGFYENKETFDHAQMIKGALDEWKRRRLEASHQDDESEQLLVPYRGDGMIRISIVIPVYNCSEYLDETIDSVVNQSMKQIEIICINDGSDDDSEKVLLRRASEDKRISVYTQRNHGPSRTRNTGMLKAQGEYLYFLDGDDMLTPDSLENMYHHAKKLDTDVLLFDADVVYDQNCGEAERKFRPNYRRTIADYEVLPGKDMFNLLCERNEYYVIVWLILQKTEFARNINDRFVENIIYEDNAYTFSTFIKAQRTAHIPGVYIKRRIHPDSIMTKKPTWDNVNSYFVMGLKMMELYYHLSESEKRVIAAWAMHRIRMMFWHARQQWKQLSYYEKGRAYGSGKLYPLIRELVMNPGEYELEKTRYQEQVHNLCLQKSEINAKLQQTYREKSEINAKLQLTYQEKSEINAKLKQTSQEKSELNRELKQALKDCQKQKKAKKRFKKESQVKEERICELEKQNSSLQAELESVLNSRAYRFGVRLRNIKYAVTKR